MAEEKDTIAMDRKRTRRGMDYGRFLEELWQAGIIEACSPNDVLEETDDAIILEAMLEQCWRQTLVYGRHCVDPNQQMKNKGC